MLPMCLDFGIHCVISTYRTSNCLFPVYIYIYIYDIYKKIQKQAKNRKRKKHTPIPSYMHCRSFASVLQQVCNAILTYQFFTCLCACAHKFL